MGDGFVEFVHLVFDPAEVAGFAVDVEDEARVVFGEVCGEGLEEVGLFEEGGVAGGKVGEGVFEAVFVDCFGAEELAQVFGGFFEGEEELDFGVGFVRAEDEGFFADADVERVANGVFLCAPVVVFVRAEVDHFEVGKGPAALGDEFEVREVVTGAGVGGGVGALLFEDSEEEVVVEEDHLHCAPGFPGCGVEFHPVAGFDDDVPAWNCGKELLGAFDFFP